MTAQRHHHVASPYELPRSSGNFICEWTFLVGDAGDVRQEVNVQIDQIRPPQQIRLLGVIVPLLSILTGAAGGAAKHPWRHRCRKIRKSAAGSSETKEGNEGECLTGASWWGVSASSVWMPPWSHGHGNDATGPASLRILEHCR